MAKNRNNNFWVFSGKLGNIIGYQRFGVQCFRTRPNYVRNPNTPAQMMVRNRFKAFQLFTKKCLNRMLYQIWKSCTVEMTGYNLFVKTNIGLFDEHGNCTDYRKLKMSTGILPLPPSFKFEARIEENCVVSVRWDYKDRDQFANPNDRLQVTAIINREVIHVHGLTACRNDKTATFQLPCGRGTPIHLYVYFYDQESMVGSPSYYQMVEVKD